jgi:hypothetical protein
MARDGRRPVETLKSPGPWEWETFEHRADRMADYERARSTARYEDELNLIQLYQDRGTRLYGPDANDYMCESICIRKMASDRMEKRIR